MAIKMRHVQPELLIAVVPKQVGANKSLRKVVDSPLLAILKQMLERHLLHMLGQRINGRTG